MSLVKSLGGAVGDLWGEFSGGNAAARAAGRAAMERQRVSKEEREIIMKEGRAQQEAAMNLAEATPQELQAYERQLSASMDQIARREKMIEAIDPALLEASDQVLKLLRGEESGMTQAANAQRRRQRAELVDMLREQYGPGAETSSLGQQALQRFDEETNMLTQQQQQSSLAQVFGIASAAPGLTNMNNSLSALNQAGMNFGSLQQRKLGTQMQTGGNLLSALSGTSQNIIDSAGAQYMEPMIKAQNQQKFMGKLLEGGIAYATGGGSSLAKMFAGGGGSGGGGGGMSFGDTKYFGNLGD